MTEAMDTTAIQGLKTPFYLYDDQLLQQTLDTLNDQLQQHPDYHVHYAVKANANPLLLRIIQQAGLGVDCVSGGELQRAIRCGFAPESIVFAGVGKTDEEINLALQYGIACLNVESEPELETIQELAEAQGKTIGICLRINPNVGAHTHANITTGLAENKFGIAMEDMERLALEAQHMPNVSFLGLHFHIGSQILDMQDFADLCKRINELQTQLEMAGIYPRVINVGGGLGIDYAQPRENPIPDFKAYFDTYAHYLQLRPGQSLHFELGRAIVAQCGSLITRVTFVKQARHKQFVIVDAGMNDLIRPALYQAYHATENISATHNLRLNDQLAPVAQWETYDVVGPVCESSDVFVYDATLPTTRRGDFIALRSAGAYGEIMASQYNCRPLAKVYTVSQLEQSLHEAE